MGDDLKPCPFCGGRAAYDEIEKTNDTIVRCQGCYAAGAPGGNSVRPDAPDPVAAAAWNRRPVEDALWVAREAAVTRAETAKAERDAAIARADLAEFKLRRFLPTESGRRCGSIPPCAGCCRDSSGAKCATPRKAQEAKAAEVESWADLYSRAKAAEARAEAAGAELACLKRGAATWPEPGICGMVDCTHCGFPGR